MFYAIFLSCGFIKRVMFANDRFFASLQVDIMVDIMVDTAVDTPLDTLHQRMAVMESQR